MSTRGRSAATRRQGRRGSARTAEQSHRDWLALVDTEGPFLAVPPLKRVYASGMPPLDASRRSVLRDAKPAFDRAWDALAAAGALSQDQGHASGEGRRRAGIASRRTPGMSEAGSSGEPGAAGALRRYRTARDAWVSAVLREVMNWGADGELVAGADPRLGSHVAVSHDEAVRLHPTWGLSADERLGALVLVVDPVESLREPGLDGWAATAIDRMEMMLRAGQQAPSGATQASAPCSIGVVTDGRWWALVSAPPSGMAASGIVDAQTWIEEPATRDAFMELLSVRRLLGGQPKDRLPALFEQSVVAAEKITEALGAQVRRAVELLVSAFSEEARAARDQGQEDPLPDDPSQVYEAAVTVMMRVVFLLFAQERDLLPQDGFFTQAYGLTGVLDDLEARALQEGEEALDATSRTWHRLLATSRALAQGASFEDLRLPAYGGSLFEAERHPFLSALTPRGTLRVSVPDRVMLHVLRAVQVAHTGKEARRVSFRDIDVEQIGYIYEGLLGYTARRATSTVLGLIGSANDEPEVPLKVLDELTEDYEDDVALADLILAWVNEHQPSATPPSKAKLTKALRAGDAIEDAERALLSVSTDKGTRDALRPWIGVIRRDLRGKPTVVLPGGLYVAETPSRRNAGAHYTPRSLAEEVVRHALEPLIYSPGPYQTPDRSQWRLLRAEDIEELKVADIACGSGAFLVAAARFLAGALMEAWTADGSAEGIAPQHLESMALRKVVSHCLYGADINPMAVEMCKLSLWLVSLDKTLPFSFVDDKVLVGNSLLGITNVRQLNELRIDPENAPAQTGMLALDASGRWNPPVKVDSLLRRVAARRRNLASEVTPGDPQRDTNAKRRIYAGIQAELATALRLADSVIAAGLAAGGAAGKARNEAYEKLRAAVMSAYPASGEADDRHLEEILERGLRPTVLTDYERWQCLHWPLVLPDVMVEHGGFDAIIGNPPFRGGQLITGDNGTNIRNWYVTVLADSTRGSADLSTYFYLRSMHLLKPGGALGLLGPNTIAQGASRKVGLDRMAKQGFTITRAIRSRPWPAQSAALEYAAVWGTKGAVSSSTRRVCDELEVSSISTLLKPAGAVDGSPIRLKENKGITFQGCVVLGKGFILEPDEAKEWIAEEPRNAEVLFPYLDGDDLNSRPDATGSRWIIDFTGKSKDQAGEYSPLLDHVRTTVKPERDRKNNPRWWLFHRPRPDMRQAMKGLDEVLVIARVSKPVIPLRILTGSVMSEQIVVFTSESYSLQAFLSSSLHQYWVITYGSTLETRTRYTPSDVFETFPRPRLTADSEAALEAIGRTLDAERREMMLRRNLGLTELYNLVNDPDLPDAMDADAARLRAIHTDLDHAVMAAYGWQDVPLDHGFYEYRGMTRWTMSPAARVTVLDRLLALNHERAAQEAEAAKQNAPHKKRTRQSPRSQRSDNA